MDMHGWSRNLYMTNSTLDLFPVLQVVKIELRANKLLSNALKIPPLLFWQLNFYTHTHQVSWFTAFSQQKFFRTFSEPNSLLRSPVLGNGIHNASAKQRKQPQEFNFVPFLSLSDDNSNQSSIADSSPVKQENSCSTSPTPEPTTVPHRENSEVKTDQSPDSKRGETQTSPADCM